MKSKKSVVPRRIVPISGLFAVIAVCCVNITVKAQEAALIQCIQEYTVLGISPDAALAQCNKATIRECVERLTRTRIVVRAIEPIQRDSAGHYLIDLGDDDSRWLEGPAWRGKSCQAHTEGPYRRQSDQISTFWNTQRSYEWFRQGWCEQPKVVIDHNYSTEEAATLCELGFDPSKDP